jgi:hypothetical protein
MWMTTFYHITFAKVQDESWLFIGQPFISSWWRDEGWSFKIWAMGPFFKGTVWQECSPLFFL